MVELKTRKYDIKPVSHTDIYPYRNYLRKEHVALSDNSQTHYIGIFTNDQLIGFAGWMINNNSLRFKTDWINNNYRGNGLYKVLFIERIKIVEILSFKIITAFCTQLSLPTYLKFGFEKVDRKVRKNNIVFVQAERNKIYERLQKMDG